MFGSELESPPRDSVLWIGPSESERERGRFIAEETQSVSQVSIADFIVKSVATTRGFVINSLLPSPRTNQGHQENTTIKRSTLPRPYRACHCWTSPGKDSR